MNRHLRLVAIASAAVSIASIPFAATAEDGVVEINQTCAMTTGCAAADTAGFPVSISTGSYVLTSDLNVTNPNLSGIVVLFSSGGGGAQIDLNGFSIVGPVICAGLGSAVNCTPGGTGIGVATSSQVRVTIRNGRIRGFGAGGIQAPDSSEIRNVVAESNGGIGIRAEDSSIIEGCSAYQNASNGILANQGSVVRGNISASNGNSGISCGSGSVALRNAVYDNATLGINCGGGSVVRENTAYQNETNGIGGGGQISENAANNNAASSTLR